MENKTEQLISNISENDSFSRIQAPKFLTPLTITISRIYCYENSNNSRITHKDACNKIYSFFNTKLQIL